MRPIIDEVTAGLLAFCLEIAAITETRKAVEPEPNAAALPFGSVVDACFYDAYFFRS
jgi:hypothetical protein